jgi:RNA polymerase sigma factor (sigma-70 family)
MTDALVSSLRDGRQRFLELVADLRPELHRYCARMTGSVADGEDIVQDTLARALYALAEMEEPPPLRPWLFRIAHNRALDHLRRYEARMTRPLEDAAAVAGEADPEDAFAREQATRAAVARFVELAPAQRSAVILKDVLGHSLEEIAELLELTVPAVKAALHRGRTRLRELGDAPAAMGPISAEVAAYVERFNARDWDAVRRMLADDVRLDLVSRAQRSGRRDVSAYFTNYDAVHDWHLVPAWIDGRESIAVYRHRDEARPSYLVRLTFDEGRIVAIQDYRYVPYLLADGASNG